jgi:hypothetical protein
MKQPNPWAPLVQMYRLGAQPIGYAHGEFVVFCPPCEAKTRKKSKVGA